MSSGPIDLNLFLFKARGQKVLATLYLEFISRLKTGYNRS
jgi:hypothetical protein